MTKSVPVRIYTTPWCGYCTAAIALLNDKGISFEQIDVSSNKALREEMTALSGGRTVPQIFIDGQAVGGYDDIAALEQAGKLNQLLGLN